MVYVLIEWMVVGVSAFLWGRMILHILSKINYYENKKIDLVLMVGLCALTVYAQIISLFHRVNRGALLIVLLSDIVILILSRKELIYQFKEYKGVSFRYRLFAVIGICLLVLIWTCREVQHYDTSLYHAQAIRWIEEYGIVPGLGNLHFRFAYNSSFLCLQALFSLKFLFGQSLHGMNGFVMWIMLSYAICSMKFWKHKRFFTSDLLRLILIIYYVENISMVSSPGTDMFIMGLVVYIISKWVELFENKEKQVAPYAYLCILCVYGLTLKLSAGMLIFLVVMPAYRLISEKKWGEILLYLSLGILVAGPFLARNVIISGYLLYPYPELDLFSVDWKMPTSVLIGDRKAIKTWAWGLKDANRADAVFSEWFPVWKSNLGRNLYIVFLVCLISIPFSLVMGVVRGLHKKEWNFLHISTCMILCFLFWFLSAPLLRYGKVYLFLLPVYLLGNILEMVHKENIVIVVMVALGTYYMAPLIKASVNTGCPYPIASADYELEECRSVEFGSVQVYIPIEGDQAGYYDFPSTNYESVLQSIEMRGTTLDEGFRAVLQ